MKRTPVVSTNVVSIGYDVSTKVLEVEFIGWPRYIYQYLNVPVQEYQAFMAAKSKGAYVANHLTERYHYVKVAS